MMTPQEQQAFDLMRDALEQIALRPWHSQVGDRARAALGAAKAVSEPFSHKELLVMNQRHVDLRYPVTSLYDPEAQQPPAQPSQAGELSDTQLLDYLIFERAYVVNDPDACDGHWLHYARPDGTTWVQATEYETPRAAIIAAINAKEAK